MSEEKDPLAALSAAAQKRTSKVKPRQATPPAKVSGGGVVKRKRGGNSQTMLYVLFAAMGVILVGGIVLTSFVMCSRGKQTEETSQREPRQRPNNDDRLFFPGVKSQP